MRGMRIIFFGLIVLYLLETRSMCVAWGRRIEIPSVKELFERSDIAVIVTVIKDEETGRSIIDKDTKNSFLEVKTTFCVQQVVKGTLKANEFTVVRYREKASLKIINGPLLETVAKSVESSPLGS